MAKNAKAITSDESSGLYMDHGLALLLEGAIQTGRQYSPEEADLLVAAIFLVAIIEDDDLGTAERRVIGEIDPMPC